MKPQAVFWLLCCAFGGAASGQAINKPFSVLSPVVTALQPAIVSSFVAGDFNGDGKADLAVLSYPSTTEGTLIAPNITTLSVFIGNGDGSFQPGVIVATFPVAGGSVNTGDFNGDGKLDLVVVSGSLSVFLGNGNGAFANPIQYPSPLSTQGVLVADINRDGKPDLVVGGGALPPPSGTVLLGNGDGTFQPGVSFPGAALIVADFNKDSNPDILANDTGALTVLLGRGNGAFTTGQTIAGIQYVTSQASSNQYIVSGDFNGDGNLDLVLLQQSAFALVGTAIPANLALVLGNGDGTFQAPKAFTGLGGAILALDLNQDGKFDLVSDYSVMLGRGDGTFGPPYYLAVPSFNCHPTNAIVGLPVSCGIYQLSSISADVNGDGMPDLITVGLQPPPDHFYSNISLLSSYINDSPGDGFITTGVSATGGTGVSTIPGTPTVPPVITARGPGFAIGENSLVTAYGANLAPAIQSASGPPYPTTLGGIQLHVGDSLAQLLYVSPTQINYLSPTGPFLAVAEASFANPAIGIERIGLPFVQKGLALPMVADAPGLFTVDSSGIAAATAVRVAPSGAQTAVPVFDCSTSPCTAVPIDLSGDPVYLSLYGTGFDYRSSEDFAATVTCSGGTVSYFGPQSLIPGLNQVNLLLRKARSGPETISCEMVLRENGINLGGILYVIDVTSNPVQILIK
jgi:uncharacterized protein (TIGR03437 family)